MVNNDTALEKSKARDLILDSARDYLTAKITLPLGNPSLKNVHTNQFLWTELPNEFPLENWETIADSLQSSVTRYTGSKEYGYSVNRWYIETCDINVDVSSGKAEMQLGLNAFASSTSEYTEGYRSLVKAYTDAINKASNESSKASQTGSGKSTTNAVKTKSLINDSWVKKYSVPSAVVNQIKKICKAEWTDYKKVRTWFEWMDKHIGYDKYYSHKYSESSVLNRGKGNCVDNSRLFRAGCLCMGIKCNFVKNTCTSPNHQYNKVYIDKKTYIVDVGRSSASWGSNWGGHASCGKETTNSW